MRSQENLPLTLSDGEIRSVNLIGSYFEFEGQATEPSSRYIYEWTNSRGISYSNTVDMAPAVSVAYPSAPTTSHSRAVPLIVVVEGTPAAADESITAELCALSADATRAESCERQPVGANLSAVFESKILQTAFRNGVAHVTVKREKRNVGVNGHDYAGGILRSTYSSRIRTFQLVD